MASPVTTRPDVDIEEDIQRIMRTYPPLSHDSHRIQVQVQDGSVTISGYVKALQTARYLRNRIATTPGVRAVNADALFDDESIRLQVGRVIPVGVYVNPEYGAVILSGKPPSDVSVEDLVKKVALVPGVHRVITSFNSD